MEAYFRGTMAKKKISIFPWFVIILFLVWMGGNLSDEASADCSASSIESSSPSGTAKKYTDAERCSLIEGTLKSINVNVLSVKIADGRANGGERVLIVLFKSNIDPDQHGPELVKVFECGHILNKKTKANLDSVAAVVGNAVGNSRAIVAVKVSAVTQFMRDKNAEVYMRKWTMKRMDKTYLTIFASRMGW